MDDYPGKIYPDTETEYVFSQSGSGNDGGFNHDQAYQRTPAMVNHTFFGVRIETYPPIGHGVVEVCYDLVEVTVEYSQPVTIAGRSPVATEIKLLKEPIVYPNPFTTKTNIQFIAAENGKVIVELYNISGVKVRTLFSGNVVEEQVYSVTIVDAQLPKGIYVYKISNGKQHQRGRIIKLENQFVQSNDLIIIKHIPDTKEIRSHTPIAISVQHNFKLLKVKFLKIIFSTLPGQA